MHTLMNNGDNFIRVTNTSLDTKQIQQTHRHKHILNTKRTTVCFVPVTFSAQSY